MKSSLQTGSITRSMLICLLAACLSSAVVIGGDWPNWRGPSYNGISDEADWEPKFPEGGPKILWKASIGTGFSSISVSKGKALDFDEKAGKKHKRKNDLLKGQSTTKPAGPGKKKINKDDDEAAFNEFAE